jgi:hypothetical protein
MRAIRAVRRRPRLLTFAAVCAGILTYAGCGGTKDNETVIPEEAPADKAKESMDYYRNQMQKGN